MELARPDVSRTLQLAAISLMEMAKSIPHRSDMDTSETSKSGGVLAAAANASWGRVNHDVAYPWARRITDKLCATSISSFTTNTQETGLSNDGLLLHIVPGEVSLTFLGFSLDLDPAPQMPSPNSVRAYFDHHGTRTLLVRPVIEESIIWAPSSPIHLPLSQKRGRKSIGRWYRSILSHESARLSPVDEEKG